MQTTVHCEVRQVYKAPPEANVPDGSVTLTALGGEVRIGRQRVRARHDSASFLTIGAEYLVFSLAADGGRSHGGGSLNTGAWYLVDGNDLVAVATGFRQEAAGVLADIVRYVVAERP